MESRTMTRKEIELTGNFIESLKTENVDLFWSCLSKCSKEKIQSGVIDYSEDDVMYLLKKVKENYGDSLEKMGVGNKIRFTNEEKTKGFSLNQNNVQTTIHFFPATEINATQLPLELDDDGFKINLFNS